MGETRIFAIEEAERVMWLLTLLVIACGSGALWWFRGKGAENHREAMFVARSSGHLFDLGLDVKRLQGSAKARFYGEAHALHSATKGNFNAKRWAMRFFGWYCVENEDFDARPLFRDGALAGSIPIMRSWAASDPDLATAAEKEITLIVNYLYKKIDESALTPSEKISAQLALLEMAADGAPDG